MRIVHDDHEEENRDHELTARLHRDAEREPAWMRPRPRYMAPERARRRMPEAA